MREKIEVWVKNLEFVNVILFLHLLKCLVISVSYPDAIVFISLIGLNAFKTYNKRFELSESTYLAFKEKTQSEIKELREVLGILKTGQVLKPKPVENKKYF